MEIRQGMITWATMLLPNGKTKRRPVVIVPPTALIKTLDRIRVVGISASYRPDDPNVIPLPWRTDGNIFTGLKEPSAVTLALQDLVDKKLLVPTTCWIGKAALIEMIERLKSAGS
jgi:hypothetical protein